MHAKVTGFEEFHLELEHSDNDHNPCLTEELLKSETKKDQTLVELQETITLGWPDDKRHLATNLRPFWTFREELSVHNGIFCKSQQVLIPQSMYSTMLEPLWGRVKHSHGQRSLILARHEESHLRHV